MTQTAKTAADRQRVEAIARRLMPHLTDDMTYGQRSRAMVAWRTAIIQEAGVSRDWLISAAEVESHRPGPVGRPRK